MWSSSTWALHAPTPSPWLAVLMAQARRRLHEGQKTLDLDGVGLEDEGVPQRPGLITSKRSALLWQVLTGEAYTRLGFDVVNDDAFAQLVLARIIEPTSKADSVRVLNEIGVASASLRTMFRALHRAQERDYRGQIATACFNHALASGDVSLVLYDVTTLYCEAENEDDLRKVGYSKERRVVSLQDALNHPRMRQESQKDAASNP